MSSEDLAHLLLTGLVGDLPLLALHGQTRVPIGLLRDIDVVPPLAQHLSLVSTLEEIRGFSVLRSPAARQIPLNCVPSFEVCSPSGETALVFVTDPSVDIVDILTFFRDTFSSDRHNYRICLDLPLLKNGWYLTEKTATRLRAKGCRLFSFEGAGYPMSLTVH
jgi:hypothetical protein